MRSWRSLIDLPPAGPDQAKDLRSKTPPDSRSLRLQLVILVTIALLPMALWSFVQGMESASRDIANVRTQLVAIARTASTPAQNVLASADQLTRAVANLPSVRNVSPTCSQDLADTLRGLMFFTDISRIDRTGKVVCSATRHYIGVSVIGLRAWRLLADRNDFVVDGQESGNGRPIIFGLLPLRGAGGAFDGAVAIVIDVRWLDYMIRTSALPADSVVALFDRTGTIIASNTSGVASSLFGQSRHAGANSTVVGTSQDRQGDTWISATHALLGDNVFVGFAMRRSSLFRPTYIHVGTDFLLPFLMIALSWLAVWLVTERQLTRWIIYLRRISGAYRAGHYALKPALEGAPSEFRMLGDALSEMASSIQDRDRSLREAVNQKTVLIKEIHHRVKNNLQIVMSLLSLQSGRVGDPAAQDALTQARVRINALALVHRILYEIEDQQSVDVKSLLELLTEQTNEGFGGDRRDIRTSVNAISLRVSGDVAVPIALFAVEALTNAYKHAYPPGRGGLIKVQFARAPNGKLRITVEDDGVGFDNSHSDTSVGSRLIKTFGQQLGGAVAIHSSQEYGTIAELVFPMPHQAE